MAGDVTLAGRTVLITGASGFLGSHVARGLDAAGATVHALVRPESSLRRLDESLRSRLTFWMGDVMEYGSVLRCCRGAQPTEVVHLAGDTAGREFTGDWRLIDRSVAVNLNGTLNVVRASVESGAPVKALIRAGGLEEYGTGPVPYAEAQRERPSSPYSAGQVAATHFCAMLQQHARFAITSLRPALVYGPAQATSFFIPKLIRNCLRGMPFEMTTGEQCRDFLYVDDLVDAFLRAIRGKQLRGEIINIASGAEVSIRSVADEIVRLTNAHGVLRIGAVPERAAELKHLVAETGHATSVLGWKQMTDLTSGLTRTIDWYRTHPAWETNSR